MSPLSLVQLLDKMPGKNDAVFAWHQDMAYWPNTEMTPDTRTVTFSLAFDSTNKQNGCIHYIPGMVPAYMPHFLHPIYGVYAYVLMCVRS